MQSSLFSCNNFTRLLPVFLLPVLLFISWKPANSFLEGFLTELQQKMFHFSKSSITQRHYLACDKPLYEPGDVVYFSVFYRRGSAFEMQPGQTTVELINPQGTVEASLTSAWQQTNADFNGNFNLKPDQLGGIYKLKVSNGSPNDNNLGFEREFQVQNVVMPRLKLTLDFEKKAYGPGSPVMAKIKAFTNANRPLSGNKFHFVVSLNGVKTEESDAVVDKKGNALVRFNLPEKLSSTDGQLNLIFKHEGLSESISRSIPIVLNKIDLSFFPEGGELVTGLESKLAFRALNEFKKPADISGEILDENGKQVAAFSSFHDGMGELNFKPLEGKTYKARITSPAGIKTLYALPISMSNGYVLQVARQTGDILKVNVRSTIKAKAGLVGQIKGQVYFQKMLDLNPGDNLTELAVSELPMGILQLTLFDQKTIERAERLVFVNNHKQLQLKVKTDKEKYLPREKVRLTVTAADETGMPMPANVVLSVTDDQMQTFMNDKSSTLLSWMLVETEIKGKVEEPKFYFDKTEPKAPEALDLLLKTAGWRRFTWEAVRNTHLPHYQYSGEILLSKAYYSQNFLSALDSNKELLGQVFINRSKQMLSDANVTLIRNGQILGVAKTNETGHFRFNTVYQGKYDLEVRKDGIKAVLITGIGIEPHHSTNLTLNFPVPEVEVLPEMTNETVKVSYVSSRNKKAALKGSLTNVYTEEPVPNALVILKQKGKIIGKGITNHSGKYSIAGISPGAYTLETPNPGYLPKTVKGIKIKEGKITSLAFGIFPDIRNLSELEITAYENPMVGYERKEGSLTGSQILRMPTRDVSNMTNRAAGVVAKREEALNIGGSRQTGTVYYGNGVKQLVAPNLPTANKPAAPAARNLDGETTERTVQPVKKETEPHNYTRVREFSAPDYSTTRPVTERTDFRKTLFWAPNIKIGRNGVATVEFYTADAITSYNITAEGIAADGSLGRTENKFYTELTFSLAAKLPGATLEDDLISIPVILKNNLDKAVTGKLAVTHPAGWKFTGTVPEKLVIKADSAKTIYLSYQVLAKPGAYEFAATFSSDGLQDAFSQPVTVEQRGYPIHKSIAGSSKEQNYQLNLTDMTPGTAQVSFVAYPNLVADLFKGIEGILREPYGCFEQTSSSSYPNLMVLDYLKEQNRPDPTAVARATDLLEKGYKRLVTFETPEKGYDWYGRAPGHSGLTAYGLLQFSDMKRVGGNVSEAMMERTKTWMLAQRDGKGGFISSSQRYGSADPLINNAYIVYSLVEAGYPSLHEELAKVYQAALSSGDPYQLALAAIAHYSADKKLQAKELTAKLLTKQAPDGSWTGLKHSFTYSTGHSLTVETTSLALLAMLKADEKPVAEIQKAIKFLQGSRNGYGSFGSTQATILALKALSAYARYSKRTAESGTLQFYVENKKAGEKEYAADHVGEIAFDNLQTYFAKPGNYQVKVQYQKTNTALPYSLALNYFSNTPPSSPDCKVKLETVLGAAQTTVGSTVRYTAKLINLKPEGLPTTMAIIGIPAGLSVQPWQLKELQEKKVIDFYEITGNRLVCYFRDMAPSEVVTVNLDLKAEFLGTYQAPSGSAYLYYTNEHKNWAEGIKISIKP